MDSPDGSELINGIDSDPPGFVRPLGIIYLPPPDVSGPWRRYLTVKLLQQLRLRRLIQAVPGFIPMHTKAGRCGLASRCQRTQRRVSESGNRWRWHRAWTAARRNSGLTYNYVGLELGGMHARTSAVWFVKEGLWSVSHPAVVHVRFWIYINLPSLCTTCSLYTHLGSRICAARTPCHHTIW